MQALRSLQRGTLAWICLSTHKQKLPQYVTFWHLLFFIMFLLENTNSATCWDPNPENHLVVYCRINSLEENCLKVPQKVFWWLYLHRNFSLLHITLLTFIFSSISTPRCFQNAFLPRDSTCRIKNPIEFVRSFATANNFTGQVLRAYS